MASQTPEVRSTADLELVPSLPLRGQAIWVRCNREWIVCHVTAVHADGSVTVYQRSEPITPPDYSIGLPPDAVRVRRRAGSRVRWGSSRA